MSEKIDLGLISNSLKRVGRNELTVEELKEFVMETLKYESHMLKTREQMLSDKEIIESKINEFDFYTDDHRTGVLIQLKEEHMYSVSIKDGKPVFAKALFKKKDGNFVVDDDGNKVPTGRVFMRLKTRRGGMALFISTPKFDAMDQDGYVVLIGKLQEQYKNLTTDKYLSKVNMEKEITYSEEHDLVPDNYTEAPSFSLNLWQIAKISQKGKSISLDLPDCNWKKED
jgi:hypothetical protein